MFIHMYIRLITYNSKYSLIKFNAIADFIQIYCSICSASVLNYCIIDLTACFQSNSLKTVKSNTPVSISHMVRI